MTETKLSGEQWAKSLISFLWQACHLLWNERCDQLHDPNATGGGRSREEVIMCVRALYDLWDKVNHFDRDIFSMSLEGRLLLPTCQLNIWAIVFQPVLAKAVLTTQLQDLCATLDIHAFFTRQDDMI